MSRKSHYTLEELGPPLDIVAEARTNHREFTPEARSGLILFVKELEWYSHCIQRYTERQDLIALKVDLKARIKLCQGLLSGVRRLADDILGRIFEYYVSPRSGPAILPNEKDNVKPEDLIVKGTFHQPETLRLVCRRWKVVVDERTVLWSKVLVKAEQTTWDEIPKVTRPYDYGLEKRVDRLLGQPWSLTVIAPRRSRATQLEENTIFKTRELSDGIPVTSLFCRQAYNSVDRLIVNFNANQISEMGKMSFPNVISTVLHVPKWGRRSWDLDAAEDTLPEYLPSLPKLKKAIIDHHILFPGTVPRSIPWAQLTHLYLGENLPYRQWKADFKHCVSLERGCFHLSVCTPVSDPSWDYKYPQTEEAALPHLKELAFLKASMFLIPDCSDICMPSLTKLQIVHRYKSPVLWDFDNAEFGRNLTHLTLMSDTSVSGKDLVPIFRRVPLLKELLFRVGRDFDEVFRYLTVRERDPSNPLTFLERLAISIRPVPYEASDYDESDVFSSDDGGAWGGGMSGDEEDCSDEGSSGTQSDEYDEEEDEDPWSDDGSEEGASHENGMPPNVNKKSTEPPKAVESTANPAKAKDCTPESTNAGCDSEDEVELPRSRYTRYDSDDEPRRSPQWGDWDYDPTPYAWEVDDYYHPDPATSNDPEYRRMWEEMGWRPDTPQPQGPVFDYNLLAGMVESRTREVLVEGVARLESLLVRVEDVEDADAEAVVSELAEVLGPHANRGLKTEVLKVDGPLGEFDLGAGCAIREYKHWDEGFMDFLDREEKLRVQ